MERTRRAFHNCSRDAGVGRHLCAFRRSGWECVWPGRLRRRQATLESRRQAHAEKLESERRIAQELEIARQVQARLFPQIQPELKTVEYAGICVQARQVGGDYFDFLNLGPQRLGLIIGDVSGKGIAAALLMANLQASLRSQSALAFDEPEALLRSVNRLFYDNTGDSAYASLLFADYDE